MDTKILHEFIVLSKISNYARAAEELYTTEATLSRHIMALERELGQPLFYRTTRKVELTEFGLSFLPYATRIVQTVEECDSYLLNNKKTAKNQLIVGINGNVLVYDIVKRALVKFSTDNPGYSLELITEEDEPVLMDKLRNNDCDIIIMREPKSAGNDGFKRITLMPHEPLCAILPAGHPLAGQEKVSLIQLSGETFLLPPSFSNTYKLFQAKCRELGLKVKISPSPRGREIVSTLTSLGVGIPIISRTPAIDVADSSVSVVELLPEISQQISVIYPDMTRYSPILKKALKCFSSV